MEASQSHMNWGSGFNTLDNSTMMFAADCNVVPPDYYQCHLRDEDMTSLPPDSGGYSANVLQNLDDLEQLDWESVSELIWAPSEQMPLGPSQHLPWVPMEELQHPPTGQTGPVEFPTVDQSEESHETCHEDMTSIPPHSGEYSANVLQNLGDLEQLDWESALEPIWASSEQMPLEPSQHLPWVPMEELQCPPSSQTGSVEFPTVDQSEESLETGGEHESRQKDHSAGSLERGGECSDDHIYEATSPPVLPSGETIGVTFHKKNKQWEAHLWVKGHQLRGRKKKGVQIFLGNFETEQGAKMAHDRAAIKLGMPPSARGKPYPLNFPAAVHASYMEEHAHWTARDFLWKIRRTSNKFSKGKSSLKGVTLRKQSVKRGQEWAAKYESKLSLTAKEFGDDMKRTFMLGNFESEEEAGQAYDRALLFLHQNLPEVEQLCYTTNYRPSSYSAADIEAMASKLQCHNDDCSGSVPLN